MTDQREQNGRFSFDSHQIKRHMNHYPIPPKGKSLEIDMTVEFPEGLALRLALEANKLGTTVNDLVNDICDRNVCSHSNGTYEKMGGKVCNDCNTIVGGEYNG